MAVGVAMSIGLREVWTLRVRLQRTSPLIPIPTGSLHPPLFSCASSGLMAVLARLRINPSEPQIDECPTAESRSKLLRHARSPTFDIQHFSIVNLRFVPAASSTQDSRIDRPRPSSSKSPPVEGWPQAGVGSFRGRSGPSAIDTHSATNFVGNLIVSLID